MLLAQLQFHCVCMCIIHIKHCFIDLFLKELLIFHFKVAIIDISILYMYRNTGI